MTAVFLMGVFWRGFRPRALTHARRRAAMGAAAFALDFNGFFDPDGPAKGWDSTK